MPFVRAWWAASLAAIACATISLAAPGWIRTSPIGSTPGDPASATVAAEPDGRRLAGDWEPADAFLLADERLWQESLDVLLDALSPRPVYLISDRRHAGRGGGSDLVTVDLPYESAWVRDYGPVQVRDRGDVIWLDAAYYVDRPLDDAIPSWLGRHLGVPVERVAHRLEGGGIASDGRGLCAMTTASLRRLSVSDERTIVDRFACRSLIAVPALAAEPTGHVDLIVHFLRPDLVAVGTLAADASSDGDALRLDIAARLLERAAARAGRRLEIVRVPIHPGDSGEFFSYVNVVDLEEELLVPDFGAVPEEVQAEAYDVLRRSSGKKLVPVPADAIALAGGGLHCIVLGLYVKDRVQ